MVRIIIEIKKIKDEEKIRSEFFPKNFWQEFFQLEFLAKNFFFSRNFLQSEFFSVEF